MTNEAFIDQVIDYYEDARHLTCDDSDGRIIRGKNHSISGKTEDLFAFWLSQNVKPITTNLLRSKNNRKKSIQPDVFILDNSVIKGYIDVKMDLGWQRDLSAYLIDKDNLLKDLKGQKCTFKHNGKQEIRFSEKIKYQVVVFSKKNGSAKKSDYNVQVASELGNVELYILSGNQHLNMYKKNQERQKLEIYEKEFARFLEDINILLN
jgi:hypothetical protein